ncbi:MAG: acetyltransferase component of pyruvate dehydrogenase complex [Porticoccaceae bacterium]|nr:MAG: acetyltransferase component of pyruvate dehydrogenase complex [Porticoccaceae bacterium]
MAMETVKVPDLGGAREVEVIEIPVAPGDRVAPDDTLLVLESDKATLDLPAPAAGTVRKVLVKPGDKVGAGTAVVELELAEEAVGTPKETAPEKETPPPSEPEVPAASASAPQAAASEEDRAAAPAGGEPEPVVLPDLGSAEAVEVVEIAVAPGDRVAEGEALLTLESDKATMEVPAPRAGTVAELRVAVGDRVRSGQVVALLRPEGEAARSTPAAGDPAPKAPEATTTSAAAPVAGAPERPAAKEAARAAPPPLAEPEAPAGEVYAGPMVRRFARALGVDLRNVPGTGPKGRIRREDVEAYVREALAARQQARPVQEAEGELDLERFGPVEEVPLSGVDRATAANMARAWAAVPMVTQFDDADVTELEAFRKALLPEAERRGVKLTLLPFVVRALGALLPRHPKLRRAWHPSGRVAVERQYCHVGIAVDTPRGLLVPVVRDVDRKGVWQLAEEIAALAERARGGRLAAEEMQGATLSVSNLGPIGGRGFTPIVNPPEAAILGLSRAAIRPVWDGGEFRPRLLLPVALTYDHRLVNGADAGRFLTELVEALADLRRLIL